MTKRLGVRLGPPQAPTATQLRSALSVGLEPLSREEWTSVPDALARVRAIWSRAEAKRAKRRRPRGLALVKKAG